MTFDQQVTFLFVEDLTAAAVFYEGIFDLPLVLDQGSCRIYRVSPGAFIGICERPGQVEPDGVIVTFVTQDVQGVHLRLIAAGVTCEKEPQYDPEFDIVHAFYRDPDGHLIEVQRFCDTAWPTN